MRRRHGAGTAAARLATARGRRVAAADAPPRDARKPLRSVSVAGGAEAGGGEVSARRAGAEAGAIKRGNGLSEGRRSDMATVRRAETMHRLQRGR